MLTDLTQFPLFAPHHPPSLALHLVLILISINLGHQLCVEICSGIFTWGAIFADFLVNTLNFAPFHILTLRSIRSSFFSII